jgi:hypothetical protein
MSNKTIPDNVVKLLKKGIGLSIENGWYSKVTTIKNNMKSANVTSDKIFNISEDFSPKIILEIIY